MNHSEFKETRKKEKSHNSSSTESCRIAQNEITQLTTEFLQAGNSITQLPGFGIQSTQQTRYGSVVLPEIEAANDAKKAKRNFMAGVRSCFTRGDKGASIYVFLNDAGYHFRNDENRAPVDSSLVVEFETVEQAVSFNPSKTK